MQAGARISSGGARIAVLLVAFPCCLLESSFHVISDEEVMRIFKKSWSRAPCTQTHGVSADKPHQECDWHDDEEIDCKKSRLSNAPHQDFSHARSITNPSSGTVLRVALRQG